MEGLFGATGRFIFEMRRAAELCEGSTAYRWMYRNYGTVKWCLYGLVVLLNVNLLMVTYGGLAGPQNGLNGYDHIIEYDHELGAVHDDRTPAIWAPNDDTHPCHQPQQQLGFDPAITTRNEMQNDLNI